MSYYCHLTLGDRITFKPGDDGKRICDPMYRNAELVWHIDRTVFTVPPNKPKFTCKSGAACFGDIVDYMYHNRLHSGYGGQGYPPIYWATMEEKTSAYMFVDKLFNNQRQIFDRVENTGLRKDLKRSSVAWKCSGSDKQRSDCAAFVVMVQMGFCTFGVLYTREHGTGCAARLRQIGQKADSVRDDLMANTTNESPCNRNGPVVGAGKSAVGSGKAVPVPKASTSPISSTVSSSMMNTKRIPGTNVDNSPSSSAPLPPRPPLLATVDSVVSGVYYNQMTVDLNAEMLKHCGRLKEDMATMKRRRRQIQNLEETAAQLQKANRTVVTRIASMKSIMAHEMESMKATEKLLSEMEKKRDQMRSEEKEL